MGFLDIIFSVVIRWLDTLGKLIVIAAFLIAVFLVVLLIALAIYGVVFL